MQFKNLIAAIAVVSYAVAAPAPEPEPVQKRCDNAKCCAEVLPGFGFIEEIGYNCIAVPVAGDSTLILIECLTAFWKVRC